MMLLFKFFFLEIYVLPGKRTCRYSCYQIALRFNLKEHREKTYTNNLNLALHCIFYDQFIDVDKSATDN